MEKRQRGRPKAGDEVMTSTERSRRKRERDRAQREQKEMYFGKPLTEEEKQKLARRWGWKLPDPE